MNLFKKLFGRKPKPAPTIIDKAYPASMTGRTPTAPPPPQRLNMRAMSPLELERHRREMATRVRRQPAPSPVAKRREEDELDVARPRYPVRYDPPTPVVDEPLPFKGGGGDFSGAGASGDWGDRPATITREFTPERVESSAPPPAPEPAPSPPDPPAPSPDPSPSPDP